VWAERGVFSVKPCGISLYNNQRALQGQMKNTFDCTAARRAEDQQHSDNGRTPWRLTWGCVSSIEITSVCHRYDASIKSPALYKE
jgi:hypothetical protein